MFNANYKLLAQQLLMVPETKTVYEKVYSILNEGNAENAQNMRFELMTVCDEIIFAKKDEKKEGAVNVGLAFFFKGYLSHIAAMNSNDKKSAWYESAIVGYEKAIMLNGNKMALMNCAALYAEGLGVPDNKSDYKKAIDLYQRSGTPRAFYNIGLLYEDGRASPDEKADLMKAVYFFRKAFIGHNEDQKLKSSCLKKFANFEKSLALPRALPILYHIAIIVLDKHLIAKCFKVDAVAVINLIKNDELLTEDERIHKFHDLIYNENFTKETICYIAALCFDNAYKHYTPSEEKARDSFFSAFYKFSNYVMAFNLCKKIISIDNDLFIMWINLKVTLIDFSDECANKIIQLITVFGLANKPVFKGLVMILSLIKNKDNQGLLKFIDSLSVDEWKDIPINILKRIKLIFIQNNNAMIPPAFIVAAIRAYEKLGPRLDQKDEKGVAPNADAWITKGECVALLKMVLKLNIDSYAELADIFYQEHSALAPKSASSSALKPIS